MQGGLAASSVISAGGPVIVSSSLGATLPAGYTIVWDTDGMTAGGSTQGAELVLLDPVDSLDADGNYTVTAVITARSANTQFRWRQLLNSGTTFDHWAIDDLQITSDLSSQFTLVGDGVNGVAAGFVASAVNSNGIDLNLAGLDALGVQPNTDFYSS